MTAAVAIVVAVAALVGGWRLVERHGGLRPPGRRQEGITADARKRVEPTGGAERPTPADTGTPGRETGDEGRRTAEGTPAATPGEAALVSPSSAATAGAADAAIAGPGGHYVVYLSSHRIRSDAEEDVQTLAALGVRAEAVAAEVRDTGLWYRVAVRGGYPTLDEARAVLDRVAGLGYAGAWVERARESE